LTEVWPLSVLRGETSFHSLHHRLQINAESPCEKFEARRWLRRQLIGGALVGRREMKQVPGSFPAVHVHDRLGLTTERISLLSV
jgi:hypothetical protein